MNMRLMPLLLLCMLVGQRFSCARAWISCVDTVHCELSRVKAPYSKGKRAAVIPIGYPYGNDRSGYPYLPPFAHGYSDRLGQDFTFGYRANEGVEY